MQGCGGVGVFGGEGFFGRVELRLAFSAEGLGGLCLSERAVSFGCVGEDCGDAPVGGAGAPAWFCGVDRGVLWRFGGAGA